MLVLKLMVEESFASLECMSGRLQAKLSTGFEAALGVKYVLNMCYGSFYPLISV